MIQVSRMNESGPYGEWMDITDQYLRHEVVEAAECEVFEKDQDYGEFEVGGQGWAYRRTKAPKYTISFSIGPDRTATSMAEAIRKAKGGLLATRIYRGAEYAHPDGGRALDLWRDKRNATSEMGVPADAVITWK